MAAVCFLNIFIFLLLFERGKEKTCNWVGGREDMVELGRGKNVIKIYFMKTLKIKSSFYSDNRISHKKMI